MAVSRTVVVRRDARFALATGLAFGLSVAITTPSRTWAASDPTGGASAKTSRGGSSSTGGKPGSLASGGSGGRAGSTAGTNVSAGTTYVAAGNGGNAGARPASSTTAGTAGARTVAGVVAPIGVDVGAPRPTWHEPEVVLTVDPSYLALPYAKQALEGALLAWTSVADQLPRVTLRFADEAMTSQTTQENLGDHRIFFAPMGDKRANGALAITLVTTDEEKNSILDADILVNGGHLFTDVTASGQWQSASVAYDLQDVITHELGHWFGLDENFENRDATMYAYVYPRETKKRDLDQSDIVAVQLAYWQADNPNENRGCSVGRISQSPDSLVVIGWVAVVGLMVRSGNRRRRSHVPAQSCRQVA